MQLTQGSRLGTQQQGFLLLEVVVSLLISALGLLALAGVHAAALRYGKLSQHRALATQLGQDFAERLRANKAQLGDYAFGASFAAQAGTLPAPLVLCSGAAQTCSASQMAQADLAQWRQAVRAALPEGSVHVLHHASALAADVWVAWREPVVAEDETLSASGECPAALLSGAGPGVRCSYFRVQL